MRPKALINCRVNGVFYDKGDEIEVNNKEQLIKLNEIGFIEPLTPKQIQEFGKETKTLKKGGITDVRKDTRQLIED